MPLVVILLSILLIYSLARTAAFERTVRVLGLLQAEKSEEPSDTSSKRTLLVLGMYLRRVNVTFLLGMAVYLITTRASAWYYGAAILTLCWVASLLIVSMPQLHLGTADVASALVKDLEQRREWYQRIHDASRLQTVEGLLGRIRSSAPRTSHASELHR
jgi:hypothetical protein